MHTPGPWKAEPITGAFGNVGIRANGENISGYVAFIETRWLPPAQREEQIANSLLIAAAPELLEASRSMMEMIDPDGESTDIWCVTMRAAIARATGD